MATMVAVAVRPQPPQTHHPRIQTRIRTRTRIRIRIRLLLLLLLPLLLLLLLQRPKGLAVETPETLGTPLGTLGTRTLQTPALQPRRMARESLLLRMHRIMLLLRLRPIRANKPPKQAPTPPVKHTLPSPLVTSLDDHKHRRKWFYRSRWNGNGLAHKDLRSVVSHFRLTCSLSHRGWG
jgi:hypothetical protein